MEALESIIDYRFGNADLLKSALAHPSLGKTYNNQRLEFLGDAVLALVIARLLYDAFPKENEGALARRHAALVCGETLSKVAQTIGIGAYIEMAPSESVAGGRENPSNLEDACEALIGALYLDGGLEAAETFILTHWQSLSAEIQTPPKDAKTMLQEWAQGRGLPLPAYTVTHTEGPAHAPEFTIRVEIKGAQYAEASAFSKKAAEQQAARALFAELEKKA